MCNKTKCKCKKHFCRYCLQCFRYKCKKHFFRYCLRCFSCVKASQKHKETCLKINGKQSVKLRYGSV